MVPPPFCSPEMMRLLPENSPPSAVIVVLDTSMKSLPVPDGPTKVPVSGSKSVSSPTRMTPTAELGKNSTSGSGGGALASMVVLNIVMRSSPLPPSTTTWAVAEPNVGSGSPESVRFRRSTLSFPLPMRAWSASTPLKCHSCVLPLTSVPFSPLTMISSGALPFLIMISLSNGSPWISSIGVG